MAWTAAPPPRRALGDWWATRAVLVFNYFELLVEAPGVEPGSGSALLKSLRACPTIWFSSPGWPAGGASWRLSCEVSRPRPQAPARPLAR